MIQSVPQQQGVSEQSSALKQLQADLYGAAIPVIGALSLSALFCWIVASMVEPMVSV